MYQITQQHHDAMHEVLTKELKQLPGRANELLNRIYRAYSHPDFPPAGIRFCLLNGYDFEFKPPTKRGTTEKAYSFCIKTHIDGKTENFYFPIPGLKSSIIGTRFKGKHPEKWLLPDSNRIFKLVLKAVRSFTSTGTEHRTSTAIKVCALCKELIKENSIKDLEHGDIPTKKLRIEQGSACFTEIEVYLNSEDTLFWLSINVFKIRRGRQEIIFTDKIELKSIADVSRSE